MSEAPCPKCHQPTSGVGAFMIAGGKTYHRECYDADVSAARIADLERQLAEARTVKPLEWDDNGIADFYRVTFANGQGPKAFLLAHGSKIIGWHDDPDEAKAAAQADYTARILSALKDTP